MCRGTMADTRMCHHVLYSEAIFYIPVIKEKLRVNFDFHETLARSSLDYVHTYSCVAFVNIFSHRNLETR